MCCGDQCFCFIPIKMGSLIFAYIAAVISGLGTLGCFGIDLFALAMMVRTNVDTAVIVITALLIPFTSSFICSVLLLIGLTKNIPKLVKIFLIYGMILVALLVTYFIMVSCVHSYFFTAGFFFIPIAILVVYSLCLYLVFMQYRIMIAAGKTYENPLTGQAHVYPSVPFVPTQN